MTHPAFAGALGDPALSAEPLVPDPSGDEDRHLSEKLPTTSADNSGRLATDRIARTSPAYHHRQRQSAPDADRRQVARSIRGRHRARQRSPRRHLSLGQLRVWTTGRLGGNLRPSTRRPKTHFASDRTPPPGEPATAFPPCLRRLRRIFGAQRVHRQRCIQPAGRPVRGPFEYDAAAVRPRTAPRASPMPRSRAGRSHLRRLTTLRLSPPASSSATFSVVRRRTATPATISPRADGEYAGPPTTTERQVVALAQCSMSSFSSYHRPEARVAAPAATSRCRRLCVTARRCDPQRAARSSPQRVRMIRCSRP